MLMLGGQGRGGGGGRVKTAEELSEMHKKERKELQSKVTALKKSVTKGDKKWKKEVDAEVEQLEREFERKCQVEMDQLVERLKSVKVNAAGEVEAKSEESEAVEAGKEVAAKQKVSKAKKRKEKKEQSELSREQEIALQEIENKKGPAALEFKTIGDKLRRRGMQVRDMKSDGNCMYYAVADQLERKLSTSRTWKELRTAIYENMLRNPDEFQPYLTTEDGDFMDEEKYREYCEKIRDTLVWGGQLELKALADILAVQIEVVQSQGAELLIGDSVKSAGKERLVITYHRHMFGMGEHYNSTEPLSPDDE
jgi:OTU domain-containing protein 6